MAKKQEEKVIKVKSTKPTAKDGGSPVVLNEEDSRHPDGHGFVASGKTWTEVFPTPKVRQLIADGDLKEFDPDEDEDDEASDASETQAEPVVLEIVEGDTPEKLVERYDREQLFALADQEGVKVARNKKSIDIAEAILSGGGE